jgi:hypothetical protein
MMPVWLAIGLLLVAGCAPDLGTWTKPGVTPAALTQDSRECQQDARYASYDPLEPHLLRGMPPSELHIDLDLYAACMRDRGYQRVE